MLKIIVNSDNHLDVGDDLRRDIEQTIDGRLGRFGERITRIVAHVSDVNSSQKAGDKDKRCMIEARPEGRDTLNVSHNAPTLGEAVNQATRKMERLLDDTFQKLSDPKGGRPPAGRPEK
jgi:ribosome-associated translation inhibitor RaiA